ncbi:MAG TPA: hypothetical protein VIW70_00340 [Rubrivivax sp.]
MLKGVLLALLAANVLVFAWSQGWLSPLLRPPGTAEREPERLLQQIDPGSVRLLPVPPAKDSTSPAASAAATAR